MRVVAKGQAERWCSHPVSACFVDLLKPGRDADLVTFHFHHALLDQERQGAFNFLGRPAGQRRPCRPSGGPGTGIPSQPGTLRAQSPRAAVYAHPDLDQPTPQNRHQPSLNRDVGCLNVIDTFRAASRSPAAGPSTSSIPTPAVAQVSISQVMYGRWLPVTPSSE